MMFVIVLLTVIALLVDLKAAFTLLRDTDWRWILVCLILLQFQTLVSALRWQLTAVRLGQGLGYLRAVREYYIATLCNLSLPGGMTGDAARVYRNRQITGMTVSAQSVMLERLAGQVALAAVTLAGWLAWPVLMSSPVPGMGGRLLATFLLIILVLVVMARLARRFVTGRLAGFLQSFGPSMHRAWLADHQWLLQGVLSLGIVGSYLAVFAACSLALQQPLPAVAIFSIVPLVLLSMAIPLSIGGWGVREAAAASLWPLIGLSAEAGVANSILYGLVCLLGSVPGALWASLSSSQAASQVASSTATLPATLPTSLLTHRD